MKRTVLTRLALAGAAGLLLPLAGCDDDPLASQTVDLSCPAEAGGAVTLVVGARANSPTPALPDQVLALIKEAAKKSKKVQVIRLDGAPVVAFSGTFRSKAANNVAKGAELDKFINGTRAQIIGVQPKTPEADVLGALSEAARVTPKGGTVVLIDSGLQTTGQVKFQESGMLAADPKEVIEFLAKRDALPKLDGLSVLLVGLGNTAEPQETLDPSDRKRVVDFWKAIVNKQQPTCTQEVDTPAYRKSIDTDVAVSLVRTPPKPEFKACGTTVLADAGTVGFLGDQAVFRDRAAAERTLQDLAGKLRDGQQRATLIGTTASAGRSEASLVALSKARAEAVKTVLVNSGIAADRITTQGAGSHGPNKVPDRAADGSLIPAKAALNRSVVVRLTCSG